VPFLLRRARRCATMNFYEPGIDPTQARIILKPGEPPVG
jgi:hypothetical protein